MPHIPGHPAEEEENTMKQVVYHILCQILWKKILN